MRSTWLVPTTTIGQLGSVWPASPEGSTRARRAAPISACPAGHRTYGGPRRVGLHGSVRLDMGARRSHGDHGRRAALCLPLRSVPRLDMVRIALGLRSLPLRNVGMGPALGPSLCTTARFGGFSLRATCMGSWGVCATRLPRRNGSPWRRRTRVRWRGSGTLWWRRCARRCDAFWRWRTSSIDGQTASLRERSTLA
jgi:hypothetical protein